MSNNRDNSNGVVRNLDATFLRKIYRILDSKIRLAHWLKIHDGIDVGAEIVRLVNIKENF